MVKLSDIFKRDRFSSSPCIVNISNRRSELRILTYQNAGIALQEHRLWLDKLISRMNSRNEKIILAYVSSNSTDMMISILAAADTKVKVALLNHRWTTSEMTAVLQSSNGSTIILYSSEFHDKAFETKATLQHEAEIVEIPPLANKYFTTGWSRHTCIDSLSDQTIDTQIEQLSGTPSVDALLLFTSGTTSGSKGVRLSHRALWIQGLAKLRHPCRYNQTTCMLSTTVPLFHVGGLSNTLAVWLAGGTWVVPDDSTSSGFDPNIVVEMISHPQVPTNTLVVVPAMIHSLLRSLHNKKQAYPHVDLILIGGQSASKEMLDKLGVVFPSARIVQTYACTEAASSLTFHEPTTRVLDPPIPGDCVGRPPPHVQLQLVERTDSQTIINEPYKVGILATRGPHVMDGYWNRNGPPRSQPTWFVTNDLGFHDDQGLFYFCGRSKDVIRTGGETVIALEVERVLLQHPVVDECAVFGLKDDKFGETVCVAIVSNSSGSVSLDEIRQHCQSLAGYKRPRRMFVLSELPRNSSGKVLKYQLVHQFQAPNSRL
jgi:acyl-CoA synthetase (AMP-forming)/AMP-acid ligase II